VIFYELNGQPREVTIKDKSLQGKVASREKADAGNAGHVGAPIPGAVSSVAVEIGQVVEKGDRLLVMEAMKMQSTIYAGVSGKVLQKLVSAGDKVEAKDLLLVIG
jgi:pyruvate carboxylase